MVDKRDGEEVCRPYLVARVTPKHLCRFNVLMWHRPEETRSKTESSAVLSFFLWKAMKKDRRAAMALYQSDSSHSSSLTIPFLQMLYTIALLLK